jgi:hypothetical protein
MTESGPSVVTIAAVELPLFVLVLAVMLAIQERPHRRVEGEPVLSPQPVRDSVIGVCHLDHGEHLSLGDKVVNGLAA